MTIFMPCLVALWISVPNFNYSNVEIINDAVLAEGEVEAVQEVRKNLPFWPGWLPNKLINLGLDLRGGAQVLVEVILEDSYSENITGYWGDLRKILRSQRENIGSFRRTGQFGENLTLEFESFEKASQAEKLLTLKIYPVRALSILKPEYIEVLRSGKRLTIELSNFQKESINKLTMEKSLEIIRRRVDEAGTREPSIQRQGDSRILVQVPGMGSAEELLQLIGKTARLTFHKVLGQRLRQSTNWIQIR